ncbi:MAG: helix-turn-helix domain-containing protein [Gloeotrichia echinulata HAB0833]
MEIHQLFKQAMDRYGIQGKELAVVAGISQNHLSQFRSGHKWVSPEVFVALLEAMEQLSPGSRRYFCQLLADEPIVESDPSKKLAQMIEVANEDELFDAMAKIANRYRFLRNNSVVEQPQFLINAKK